MLDPRFPAMTEWAKAGVEGGIPSMKDTKIIKRISPLDDLQKAVNEVAKSNGVLLLAAGEYILREPIFIPSGVIMRGINKDSVLLSVKIHGLQQHKHGTPRKAALNLNGAENAGVENLTMKYTDVDFEPSNGETFTSPWEISVFHKPELRDTTLFVENIYINNSRNCWIQNCNLLWAGSDPIRITMSQHITCRHNFIDRSYNKNDGGMGYYNIAFSNYVLICNETIRRIRHFAVQNGSKYNVVIDNDLEVDVNFHSGDGGDNLIENNRTRIPTWHSWNPIARGIPSKHLPPGKGNFLFKNSFANKTVQFIYSDPTTIYQVSSEWGKEIALPYMEGVKLKSLYAVKWTTDGIGKGAGIGQ